MFVLANGAFKSGSTWLFTILKATEHFAAVPDAYKAGDGVGRVWIKKSRLRSFLDSDIYKDVDYLAKGHYFTERQRDTFLAYDDVYIFNIKRDTKDSLLSHFHHLIMQGKLHASLAEPEYIHAGFASYYWRLGRFKAQQLRIYHEVWNVASPKVYVTSFEKLKSHYEREVAEFGRFLGLDFSPALIAELKVKTSIRNVQKAEGLDKLAEHKRFIRRGLIGEAEQYFSEDMRADVESIIRDGLSGGDMLKYRAIFTVLDVRRKLLKR